MAARTTRSGAKAAGAKATARAGAKAAGAKATARAGAKAAGAKTTARGGATPAGAKTTARGGAKLAGAKTTARGGAKLAGAKTTAPRERRWLAKSEPDVYSIDDLARDGVTSWEGVRNYQARNFLRAMREGDLVLFYQSNAEPPGVAGIGKVVRAAYPDPTALDPRSEYHDPKATPADPRWSTVDIGFVERFATVLPLDRLRDEPALAGMELLRRGSRLSVQAVEPAQFRHLVALARGEPDDGRP